MKLLFVGTHPASLALGRGIGRGKGLQAVQCIDAGAAIEALRTAEPAYDWVFVDSSVAGAAFGRIGDALQRRGATTRLVSMRTHDPETFSADSGRPLVCSLERDEKGLQILHCALQRAGRDPTAHPQLADAVSDQTWAFEYHAPCKQRS